MILYLNRREDEKITKKEKSITKEIIQFESKLKSLEYNLIDALKTMDTKEPQRIQYELYHNKLLQDYIIVNIKKMLFYYKIWKFKKK